MSLRVYTRLFSLALAAYCAGCDDHYDRNASVLVVVDGIEITDSDVRDLVLIEKDIRERAGNPFKGKDLKKQLNAMAYRIIPQELAKILLCREFDQLGIHRTVQSDDIVLRRYNQRLSSRFDSLDALLTVFPERQKALANKICYESKLESYFQSIAEDLRVDDAELSDREEYENATRLSASVANSNAWRSAEACYAELLAGADWRYMAKKYSEDYLVSSNNVEFADEWMTYPVSGNTVDPEIALPLRGLSIGGFTKPTDTDYGIVIARLNKRDDSDLQCGRILFRLIDVAQYSYDRETLRKSMEQESLNQHMTALVKHLFNKATIKYPMGETIKYEIF